MKYKYKCGGCGYEFEQNLPAAKRKQPQVEPCPDCGQLGEVRQMLSAPSIVAGRMGGQGRTPPAWFKDRVKDMKKSVGRGNTLGNIV